VAFPFAPSLIAGAVSGALYLTVFYFGLGFLFLFLPTLPLFWLGLGKNSSLALYACFIGALMLAVFSNPAAAVVYLLFLALPAWYIARESLKHGASGPISIWFPLTVIFSRLMALCCFGLLAATLYYLPTPGGLPGMMAPRISSAFSLISSEFDQHASEAIQAAAPGLAFLIFAVSAWMWGGCLYLHAWIVNRELQRQKIAIRPHMHVGAFPPPNWMISLLLITAVASLIGGASLAFWGKASLLMLLFPYFLLGIALLHIQTKKMEHRALLLFFIYFLIAILLWPVLLVAGHGVIYHIRLLNKYLSAGGTSSKS